jgi:hypothetical protein
VAEEEAAVYVISLPVFVSTRFVAMMDPAATLRLFELVQSKGIPGLVNPWKDCSGQARFDVCTFMPATSSAVSLENIAFPSFELEEQSEGSARGVAGIIQLE